MQRLILILLFALFLPAGANAHFLWLEDDCTEKAKGSCQVKLFFGEYHQGKKEVLDGRLKERIATKLFLKTDAPNPTELEKKEASDHFYVTVPLDKGSVEVNAIDNESEVVDWRKYKIGVIRPIFYAKRLIGSKPKKLAVAPDTLDILPLDDANKVEGKDSTEHKFKLYFHGEPYKAKAEVKIYSPKGWIWEGELSDEGAFSFVSEWPGLYVVEAIVMENTPGTFKGKEYEAIRHRATLSVVLK